MMADEELLHINNEFFRLLLAEKKLAHRTKKAKLIVGRSRTANKLMKNWSFFFFHYEVVFKESHKLLVWTQKKTKDEERRG
uniref:Uncharacterized protein n=1 Tax=Utricularia reniformis TaxID=192314 RepID=A0A1Y0AZU5_9LAMI|nr:hypothetical protein AEK19_MT0393 [Utricularia reniformis]ART30663.1 hypothetical protein AEK19_MT0393 [Utricularia reniformis]